MAGIFDNQVKKQAKEEQKRRFIYFLNNLFPVNSKITCLKMQVANMQNAFSDQGILRMRKDICNKYAARHNGFFFSCDTIQIPENFAIE